MRSLEWALIQCNWYLYQKNKFGCRLVQKEDAVKMGRRRLSVLRWPEQSHTFPVVLCAGLCPLSLPILRSVAAKALLSALCYSCLFLIFQPQPGEAAHPTARTDGPSRLQPCLPDHVVLEVCWAQRQWEEGWSVLEDGKRLRPFFSSLSPALQELPTH